MKGMKVEIVSREIIKPSSATPPHLRHFKLSFLDQFAPPFYIPLVFFYHPEDLNLDPFERSYWLKKSLAATLTNFYPLAGRLRENLYVECNDEGIEYVYARATNCKLSEVIEKTDMKSLNQLVPFEPYGNKGTGSTNEVLLGVQFNVFACGGLAIGVCISHYIADGNSATTFLNAWAATARGVIDQAVHPIFVATSHFPPVDVPGFSLAMELIKDEKTVTKKFVIEKAKIIALKEQAASNSTFTSQEGKVPTRVEAISALIWKIFIAIVRSKTTPPELVVAVHAINLRPRMVPLLPVNSFGNICHFASALRGIELEEDCPALVIRLRNAIAKISGEYIKNLRENIDGYMDSMRKLVEPYSKGEIEFINFTSWCGFPIYEVDFGWGTPVWVGSPEMPYKNVVVMGNTKDGDGIEARVSMLEEDMHLFENDPELLSFVSSSKKSD